jgi:hypothetical protein
MFPSLRIFPHVRKHAIMGTRVFAELLSSFIEKITGNAPFGEGVFYFPGIENTLFPQDIIS